MHGSLWWAKIEVDSFWWQHNERHESDFQKNPEWWNTISK